MDVNIKSAIHLTDVVYAAVQDALFLEAGAVVEGALRTCFSAQERVVSSSDDPTRHSVPTTSNRWLVNCEHDRSDSFIGQAACAVTDTLKT